MSDDDAKQLARQAVLEGYKATIARIMNTITEELVVTPGSDDKAGAMFRAGMDAAKQAAAIALEIIGPL